MISPTTKTRVYDCLGDGAHWDSHRWGPRPIAEYHLDWQLICDLDSFNLLRCYGDPQCWNCFSECVASGKPVITETYLPPSSTAENIQWRVMVDGMGELSGLVYQRQSWNDIAQAIEPIASQVTVVFATWYHNVHQVPEITAWCKQIGCRLELVSGGNSSDTWSPVINSDSEWLYCVHHCDPDQDPALLPTELYRHLENYNSLRTFVKSPGGKSIVDSPMITPWSPRPEWHAEFQELIREHDGEFWAPTGHVFKNSMLWGTFMDLLASDWYFSRRTVKQREHDQWFQQQVFIARELLASHVHR